MIRSVSASSATVPASNVVDDVAQVVAAPRVDSVGAPGTAWCDVRWMSHSTSTCTRSRLSAASERWSTSGATAARYRPSSGADRGETSARLAAGRVAGPARSVASEAGSSFHRARGAAGDGPRHGRVPRDRPASGGSGWADNGRAWTGVDRATEARLRGHDDARAPDRARPGRRRRGAARPRGRRRHARRAVGAAPPARGGRPRPSPPLPTSTPTPTELIPADLLERTSGRGT